MNTKISITIDWRKLSAMSLIASKDETRYILNGVCIQSDPTASNAAILIATDGRRLAVLRVDINESLPEGFSLIIPLALIAAARPKGKPEVIISVEPDGNRQRITFTPLHRGRSVSDLAIEGNYPKWRECVPSGPLVHVKDVSVSLELAADFVTLARILCPVKQGTGAMLRSHQAGTAMVHTIVLFGVPEFIGLLMPIRNDSDCPVPMWARKPEPTPTPVVAKAAPAVTEPTP